MQKHSLKNWQEALMELKRYEGKTISVNEYTKRCGIAKIFVSLISELDWIETERHGRKIRITKVKYLNVTPGMARIALQKNSEYNRLLKTNRNKNARKKGVTLREITEDTKKPGPKKTGFIRRFFKWIW